MSLSDELFELASAYLDGETTAEETARVEADPELMAQVEELREIHEAIAAPVTPPSPQVRAAAIAAALDASATAENVTSLAARPAEEPSTSVSVENNESATIIRPSRWERFGRIGSVAAAAVAGIAVIGFAISSVGGSGETTDTATSAFETTDSATDAGEVSDAVMADSAGDAASTDAFGSDDGAMEAGAAMVEERAEAEDDSAMEDDGAMADDMMTDDDAMADETAMQESGADTAADSTALNDTVASPAAESITMSRVDVNRLDPSFADTDSVVALVLADIEGSQGTLEQDMLATQLPGADCLLGLDPLTDLGQADLRATVLYGSTIIDSYPPSGNATEVLVLRTTTDDEFIVTLINAETCAVTTVNTPRG